MYDEGREDIKEEFLFVHPVIDRNGSALRIVRDISLPFGDMLWHTTTTTC